MATFYPFGYINSIIIIFNNEKVVRATVCLQSNIFIQDLSNNTSLYTLKPDIA